MKSIVVAPDLSGVNKVIKYPVLAKFKSSGFVVLFTDKYTGVVLQKGNSKKNVGDFRDYWVNVTDENFWEILPNNYQLILQNDQ